jgi:hypothetical protein
VHGRVGAHDPQNGQGKKQASASRSACWPTRGHREAKNAGNASALASLRAGRKKGGPPRTPALDHDLAPDPFERRGTD